MPCSVTSVHLTSAKSLVGITGVVSEIQKEKKVSCLLSLFGFVSIFSSVCEPSARFLGLKQFVYSDVPTVFLKLTHILSICL